MRALDGKLSQNFNKAAEMFNNHFGNFNLPTLATESDCELFLNHHFNDIKQSNQLKINHTLNF